MFDNVFLLGKLFLTAQLEDCKSFILHDFRLLEHIAVSRFGFCLDEKFVEEKFIVFFRDQIDGGTTSYRLFVNKCSYVIIFYVIL